MPLKVSDGIGAWIKDFKKSDAPQFKGKDEKERRDMALAAYLDAKRDDKNENVSSADKKPEIYTKPDGKRGVRMVSTDRDVIKTKSESIKEVTPKSDVSELAMKTDPKIPNLKSPRDKKYRYQKPLSTYKQAKKSGEIRKEGKAEDRAELNKAMAAFLAKGGKIKRLPPGKAQGWHGKDDLGVDTHGMIGKQDTKSMRTRKKVRSMESVKEETNFQVNIEGLPMMFMSGMGQGEIMQKLRKIVKQPSMIQSVKRVTDADVKKTFRLKAQGRDDEEEQMDEANLDELSPATMNRYKKAAADDLYRSTNKYTSPISKPRNKKQRDALDKHVDKRKAGLNRAARITGTHGQQDESK